MARSHHFIVNLALLQLKRPELTATTIGKCTSLRLSITDTPSVAFSAQVPQITHRFANRTRCVVRYVDDSNSLYEVRRFTLPYAAHALTNR